MVAQYMATIPAAAMTAAETQTFEFKIACPRSESSPLTVAAPTMIAVIRNYPRRIP